MPRALFKIDRSMVSRKVRRYRDLLELVGTYVDKNLQDWRQETDKIAQGMPSDLERQEFYEFYFDDHNDQEEFIVITMNSLFLASYGLYERELNRFCERAARKAENQNARCRRYLKGAKDYLKGLGVKFPANTPEWREIDNYRLIRNKIAHAAGLLDPDKESDDKDKKEVKRIIAFARKHGVIAEWGGVQQLELTRAFCENALNDFEKSLLDIHEAYEHWFEQT